MKGICYSFTLLISYMVLIHLQWQSSSFRLHQISQIQKAPGPYSRKVGKSLITHTRSRSRLRCTDITSWKQDYIPLPSARNKQIQRIYVPRHYCLLSEDYIQTTCISSDHVQNNCEVAHTRYPLSFHFDSKNT